MGGLGIPPYLVDQRQGGSVRESWNRPVAGCGAGACVCFVDQARSFLAGFVAKRGQAAVLVIGGRSNVDLSRTALPARKRSPLTNGSSLKAAASRVGGLVAYRHCHHGASWYLACMWVDSKVQHRRGSPIEIGMETFPRDRKPLLLGKILFLHRYQRHFANRKRLVLHTSPVPSTRRTRKWKTHHALDKRGGCDTKLGTFQAWKSVPGSTQMRNVD